MPSLLRTLKLQSGATNTSGKKDGPPVPTTALGKLLQDAGPPRSDGSDKAFGFENFGNTCYANSILQCLYFSAPFREQVVSYPQRSPLETILHDAEGHARFVNSAEVDSAANAANTKSKLLGGTGARATTAANTPNKPEDKDSPDYKKKMLMANGPVYPLQYDNAASYGMDESIFTALKDLFEAMIHNEPRMGVVSPQRFLEVLRRENEMFRSTMHQDAHEFLNLLLNQVVDTVESYAKRIQASASHTTSPTSSALSAAPTPLSGDLRQPSSNSRWVHELFEGTLTSETCCLTCENVSQRDEPFLDLSVDLEENTSVTACLRKFSEEEMLCERDKFFCDQCCGLQEAEKRMKIKRLPRILALHLKRFKYTEDLQRLQKLFYRVVYPYHLRLFNTTDDAEDPDRLYELYAVVIHVGAGPYHGHYASIVKTQDCGWVLFDDELVEPVDKHYVRNFFGDPQKQACAYVLFYQETTLEAVKREFESEGMPSAAAAEAKSAPAAPHTKKHEPVAGLGLNLRGHEAADPPLATAAVPVATSKDKQSDGYLAPLEHIATAPAASQESHSHSIPPPAPSSSLASSAPKSTTPVSSPSHPPSSTSHNPFSLQRLHANPVAPKSPTATSSTNASESPLSKKERQKEEKERRAAEKERDKFERARRKSLEREHRETAKREAADLRASLEAKGAAAVAAANALRDKRKEKEKEKEKDKAKAASSKAEAKARERAEREKSEQDKREKQEAARKAQATPRADSIRPADAPALPNGVTAPPRPSAPASAPPAPPHPSDDAATSLTATAATPTASTFSNTTIQPPAHKPPPPPPIPSEASANDQANGEAPVPASGANNNAGGGLGSLTGSFTRIRQSSRSLKTRPKFWSSTSSSGAQGSSELNGKPLPAPPQDEYAIDDEPLTALPQSPPLPTSPVVISRHSASASTRAGSFISAPSFGMHHRSKSSIGPQPASSTSKAIPDPAPASPRVAANYPSTASAIAAATAAAASMGSKPSDHATLPKSEASASSSGHALTGSKQDMNGSAKTSSSDVPGHAPLNEGLDSKDGKQDKNGAKSASTTTTTTTTTTTSGLARKPNRFSLRKKASAMLHP